MKDKHKIFELEFNEQSNKGVYSIHLVKSPAMQGNFMKFKEQEKAVKFVDVDREKRIVAGLVLEPNKIIPRVNEETQEYYEVFCSEDTIEKLCYSFSQNSYNNQSGLEHQKEIEGVTSVENWLVRDEKIDTSLTLGLSCKKGSWVSVLKINNDEVWDNYIKTGEVLGFSVEMGVDFKQVNNIEMAEEVLELKKDNIIIDAITKLSEDIKSLFKPKEVVKLGSVKSEDLEIYFDGDAPVAGEPVWIQTEVEGEKIPLPVGEYPYEMGVIKVTEDGLVGELVASETVEEVPMEAEAAVAPAAEAAPDPSGVSDEAINAIKSLLIKYSEEADKKAEAKETLLLSKIEKLEGEVLEFSNKPAAVPIIASPKAFEDMTNFQKMEFRKTNG